MALVVGILVVAGCSSSKAPPGKPCLANSDCTDPLSCSYGTCHETCKEARDCPTGQDCIKATGGNVCQLPAEKTCAYKSQCTPPLDCALDRQCRSQCLADVDCPTKTQKCVAPDMVCAEPEDIDPTTGALKKAQSTPVPDAPPDAGSDGGIDGATDGGSDDGDLGGGGGAAGATGAAGKDAATDFAGDGAAGSSGAAGTGPAPCPSPQTAFGQTAQGDANMHFTTSVGVRTADQLIIFSGYSGPAPESADGGTDGGTDGGDAAAGPPPNVNLIYAQTFDPDTGAAAGPATPIFQATDGVYFSVWDVSVAPTGEIVLMHSSEQRATGWEDTLYATFFKPTKAGLPLQIARTVSLESAPLGNVQSIWSVTSQSFVLSWKYHGADWLIRVRKFLAAGTPAGGDTAAVPVPPSGDSDPNTHEGAVGNSGNLTGVVTRDRTNAVPDLTVLDQDGNQVGPVTYLSGPNDNNNDRPGVGTWISVAGTATGFVSVYQSGGTTFEVFAPTAGDGGVSDAGDGGTPPLTGFTYPSTASFGKAINDDSGGQNGVGIVQLETNGASFQYVKADGTSHLIVGTVLSSAAGTEVAITNYHGSFGISLYDATAHSTQMIASGCH